jgi:hypothetical protein
MAAEIKDGLAALKVRIQSVDGMAARVLIGDGIDTQMLTVLMDDLTPRWEPPVFREVLKDRPALCHRLDFMGGAIQVAVVMPQGMDLDGLELTLNARQNVVMGPNAEAVQDSTVKLSMETAYKVVSDNG